MGKVCVIHQNDGTDVRVGKVCRTLSKKHEVLFLGWDRDGTDNAVDLGNSVRLLYRKNGLYGMRGGFTRIAFLVWVMFRVLDTRPKTVIAVNEELAFPLLLLKPFLRFNLITDVHDPLVDRVIRGRFHWLFCFVQAVSRRASNVLWVTDKNRFNNIEDKYKSKARIIPNYPNRPDFDVVNSIPVIDDRDLRIAVIGSLHRNRGVNILRDAVRITGGCRVELAGWYTDTDSKALGQEPYARYHGILGMQDSLRLIASCDLVFCFYNPAIKNNINASPNKVYEAICMGKRCVINSETQISAWVYQNHFGYICPYNDVGALSAILAKVKTDLVSHRQGSKEFIEYASKRFYWEVFEDVILRTVS